MQPSYNDILGALICGGQSTRFGSDKRLYQINGQSLFEISHKKLKKISGDVVCVFREHAPECFQTYHLIYDDRQARGPVAGILAALHMSERPYVLTLPCDIPYIEEDVLLTLCETRSLDKIVVAHTERLEPLVALYPRSFYEKLKQYTLENNFSLEKFIFSLPDAEKKIIHFDETFSKQFSNFNQQPSLSF